MGCLWKHCHCVSHVAQTFGKKHRMSKWNQHILECLMWEREQGISAAGVCLSYRFLYTFCRTLMLLFCSGAGWLMISGRTHEPDLQQSGMDYSGRCVRNLMNFWLIFMPTYLLALPGLRHHAAINYLCQPTLLYSNARCAIARPTSATHTCVCCVTISKLR